jgi:hypothetical protein
MCASISVLIVSEFKAENRVFEHPKKDFDIIRSQIFEYSSKN